MSPYVDTFLAPEIVTQVSFACTVYDPVQSGNDVEDVVVVDVVAEEFNA
jgi:hypothetical protein